MKKVQLMAIERQYKNNGQHAEQVARFALTGKLEKADNVPFWKSGDCDGLQIKSARATVCKGVDIKAHIALDAATAYGYVTSDFSVMYVMTCDEWLEFATEFATVTTESKTKETKTRLKAEGREMKEWLMARA